MFESGQGVSAVNSNLYIAESVVSAQTNVQQNFPPVPQPTSFSLSTTDGFDSGSRLPSADSWSSEGLPFVLCYAPSFLANLSIFRK